MIQSLRPHAQRALSSAATLAVVACGFFAATPAYGATIEVCLVAPGDAPIYVRDAQGDRLDSEWASRTLVTASSDDVDGEARYLYVVTKANESGYVSRSVVKDAELCGDRPAPRPTPVTPTPVAPAPKPTPGGEGKAGDPFGCGSGQGASKCNRDALAVRANRTRHCTDYSSAREVVFFKVDVKRDASGQPYVQSVYSNDTLKLGKGMPDASEFNIEHTWPQSKLKEYPRFSETKADMYHLFAVQSRINSDRGNLPFRELPGEPSGEGRISENDGRSFEPPEQHKGFVARAMFYMAVAYDLSIDADQERVLREWHVRYPVSAEERERARRVETEQGNVNPFIENPEFVDLVADF